MHGSLTTVTCPECHTVQDVPHATPTLCISCGAEIDVMPGEYMTVIPNAPTTRRAGDTLQRGRSGQ